MSIAKVFSAQPGAIEAKLVNVETDTSVGIFNFTIVGLAGKDVDEAKDRVPAAIKNALKELDIKSPKAENRRIVTSLSPASIKKEGSQFDLPIAISYLVAVGEIEVEKTFLKESLFIGELSLSGEVLPISGALSVALLAKQKKIKNIFLPEENKLEAALVPDLNIYPVNNLQQLVKFFLEFDEDGTENIDKQNYISDKEINNFNIQKNANQNLSEGKSLPLGEGFREGVNGFDFVIGQELAKRALLIAAAGGHNIALFGPPGTGKTMLAKAFRDILPPLTREEMLEVTGIHSYAGTLQNTILTEPPFRSPHHTASNISILGGGANLRPGEITLAHRGVLFLDEFPEFERETLEALRQPLEDGDITVTRAKGSVKYPAQIMLVAALNPCPCGYRGSKIKECICKQNDLERYKRKISGPIIDRIDLWVEVSHIDHNEFKNKKEEKINTNKIDYKKIILDSRNLQNKRHKNKLNAHIKNKDLEKVEIDEGAEDMWIDLAKKFSLSPRSMQRVKKVARTIADLDHSPTIQTKHILESFQYRPKIHE